MEKNVNIGQSIEIKGQLTGNEDLTVEGKVDGKIVLKDHNLTIGAKGRISAELHAKTILIAGHVTGDVIADDKIDLAATASVEGDLRAPRVAIADGAKFKGGIEMGTKAAQASDTKSKGSSASGTVMEMPRSASAAKP